MPTYGSGSVPINGKPAGGTHVLASRALRGDFAPLPSHSTSSKFFFFFLAPACSLGLSATSQQYFSLRMNQPPATSRNQPAVLFSQNKPAPAISHQPTEQLLVLVLVLFTEDNF
jgi:hypothetical protein